jgi:hypothetical protein
MPRDKSSGRTLQLHERRTTTQYAINSELNIRCFSRPLVATIACNNRVIFLHMMYPSTRNRYHILKTIPVPTTPTSIRVDGVIKSRILFSADLLTMYNDPLAPLLMFSTMSPTNPNPAVGAVKSSHFGWRNIVIRVFCAREFLCA